MKKAILGGLIFIILAGFSCLCLYRCYENLSLMYECIEFYKNEFAFEHFLEIANLRAIDAINNLFAFVLSVVYIIAMLKGKALHNFFAVATVLSEDVKRKYNEIKNNKKRNQLNKLQNELTKLNNEEDE